MEKENRTYNKKSAVRSGLFLGLPLVLLAAALFLLSLFAYNGILKQNGIFSFMFNDTIAENTANFEDGNYKGKIQPEPENTEELLNAADDEIVPPSVLPKFTYGQRLGTFSLPRFDYYGRQIFNCDNSAVFGYGVGRAFYQWLPGQGKTTVLCAHCTNSFIYLEMLVPGDIIKIKTVYGVYEYEVRSCNVFEPSDTTYVFMESKEDEELLVCYTCYPYRTTLPRNKRYAVTAVKISGPDYRRNSSDGRWYLVDGE